MRIRASAQQIGAAFAACFGGEILDVRQHGSGHIHDTCVLRWARGGALRELLVQRFNTDVFRDPDAVMRNMARVTDHLRAKLEAEGARDLARRVLRIEPAPDGALYFRDGAYPPATYRAFHFISDAITYDVVQRPEQPFEAGRAFGEFARRLADLPAPPLIETIPGFHDTPARLAALRGAFARDPFGRAPGAAAELARVEARAELAGHCARLHARGELPLRVTHNDAKLSNLLFDARSGEALCVVDLDTVMPGFPAYDFGDLVRTTACPVAEDAADPGRPELRMDYLEQLARGYLLGQSSLSAAELDALAMGPIAFCFELAMRFLTDHVLGDVYFPIAHPQHNLQRARVQLALVDTLARESDAIRACVARAARLPVG